MITILNPYVEPNIYVGYSRKQLLAEMFGRNNIINYDYLTADHDCHVYIRHIASRLDFIMETESKFLDVFKNFCNPKYAQGVNLYSNYSKFYRSEYENSHLYSFAFYGDVFFTKTQLNTFYIRLTEIPNIEVLGMYITINFLKSD